MGKQEELMFLKKLILQNVRSIENLELPVLDASGNTRKWTLLLGENGCGKSTVLRSISLLMAGSEALSELLDNPDSWIRFGKKECLIGADLVTARGEDRHIELVLRKGDRVKDVFERNKATLEDLDKALGHTARSYLTIGYGVSRRLSSVTRQSAPTEIYTKVRAQCVATMFSPDAILNPLESWAMDLHYRRGALGLQIVKRALSDLLPGVAFKGIDKKKRQLTFDTPDGNVPLNLLSDGYQNVAGWCGDLLYRITEIFSDYKNPFDARGLLLIDEIDLHLHPTWKRQLVTFLNGKLRNFQIVATTHSALTVHQAGEGELFVLRRPDQKSSPNLIRYEGAPRNLMLHQLLMSPLFNLETIDSPAVEAKKHEFKRLRSKPKAKMSVLERKQMKDLRSELEDLPDWSTETPQDRKKLKLLEEIQQALVAKGPGALARPKKRSKRNGAAKKEK
jgi:energy-coupling factor transporter ATP-binding protein EcfA2